MTQILSKKLMLLANEPTFYCPGCKQLHRVNVHKKNDHTGAIWNWDGDVEKPTFSPSLHILSGGKTMCHSFIRNGVIQFLNDCAHRLAGQHVPLPDIPEDDL